MNDDFPDYYALLRVSRTATREEVRHAYLEEVGFWHPDLFENRSDKAKSRANATTAKLNEAAGILLNADKRQEYDEIYDFWKSEGEVAPHGQDSEEESASEEGGPISDPFDLLDFLNAKHVQFVDKRGKQGALWVIGGELELASLMIDLTYRGFHFTFRTNGGRATHHRPSWFLVGGG